MSYLTIKKVSHSLQCNTCKQSDLFDSSRNYCMRCDSYTITKAKEDPLYRNYNQQNKNIEKADKDILTELNKIIKIMAGITGVVTAMGASIPLFFFIVYSIFDMVDYIKFSFRHSLIYEAYIDLFLSGLLIFLSVIIWGFISIYLMSIFSKFINRHFSKIEQES